MSTRTRFQPKEKDASKTDGDGNDARPRTDVAPTLPTADVRAPLNDASNSPHPGRQNLQANNQVPSTTATKNLNGSRDGLTMRGIDKPLNIANLRTNKNKKAGDAIMNQAKKSRGSTVDRLKENEPITRIGTPKSFMSPRRNDNALIAATSTDASAVNAHDESNISHAHIEPLTGADTQAHILTANLQVHQTSRLPVLSPRRGMDSLASSTLTLYTPLSPTSGIARSRVLEPSRRELFPLRSGNQLDVAHIRDSLSPPSPGQRHLEGDHMFDIQIPLDQPICGKDGNPMNVDVLETNNDLQGQKQLRRATKRIGQHTPEEEFVYQREGKRMKIGSTHKETIIEDLGHMQHGGYHSRDNTPAQRFTSPAQYSQQSQAPPLPPPPSQTLANQPGAMSPGQNLEFEHHALYRLLGTDMDRYFAEHLEKYEAARKRWTDCKIEEWQAGANEMTEKFNKITELVKNHMAKKMELFASLHTKVREHNKTLEERNTSLEKMQRKLVKDSVSVLGGVGQQECK